MIKKNSYPKNSCLTNFEIKDNHSDFLVQKSSLQGTILTVCSSCMGCSYRKESQGRSRSDTAEG